MSSKRAKATRINHNGYTYLVGMPVSEQPAVLRVTSKFSRPYRVQDVRLTKEELAGLASVYVRIYQVPQITRQRLEEWRDSHQLLVESWKMLFWHKRVQDQKRGFPVRSAGIPPAALEQYQKTLPSQLELDSEEEEAEEEVDDDDDSSSDETLDHMDVDDSRNQEDKSASRVTPQFNGLPRVNSLDSVTAPAPRPAVASLPSGRFSDFAYQETPKIASTLKEHVHKEFEVARDAIKDMFIWFQNTAAALDDRDPLKKALVDMSWSAAKDLDRASRAVKASEELLDEGKTLSVEEMERRLVDRRAVAAASVSVDN
ncbi:hypothetical protein OQA88_4783 [Cercophora sp. LCS_1]